ncbi:cyclic dehypoxanthinyl futalosine synthase [soil metagenome]
MMTTIEQIATKVRGGGRVDRDEAIQLYRHAPTALLGELADGIRARKHPGRIVTYIIDRNVNYTNVCVARCNFCAFYRPVGSTEGYVLGFDEIFRKIDETIELGGGQLLLQGGHNPDLPIEWYQDLFRAVKARYPVFRLHALSPPEVIHLTRMSRLSVPQVIERLVAAGLDSIPGGGAEILVDRVRKLLNCYGKATADEWLGVMRAAHRAGLRTTATMMSGHVETLEERLEHMFRLRDLQDESQSLPAEASAKAGFTAFITWSYQPEHTELGGFEATGVEYLRTLATARIVLENFDSLQASWVTQGGKVGQLRLAYGANDMGSVMIEENVVRAAGAAFCMDEIEIVRNVENAGLVAKRRNMHYEILGDPVFRQRHVPRMLELAVARTDGDTSRPPEIVRYSARSAAEKRLRSSGAPSGEAGARD